MKKKLLKTIIPILFSGIIAVSAFPAQNIFAGEDTLSISDEEMVNETISDPDDNTGTVQTDVTAEIQNEYGIRKRDIKNAETDAVYEAYIREKADETYVQADDTFRLANAIVVKQSLYDGAFVEKDDDIDSIMSGIEEGDDDEFCKFITQLSDIVAVYDLSESSSYYVAYIDTMQTDDITTVRDVDFALNDNDGNLVDGCIYDETTGLAYLPKDLFFDENGTEILLHLQAQLMQVIYGYEAEEDISSEVMASTDDTRKLKSAYISSSDIFDFETTVQVETGLNEERMGVSVNGVPTDDYEYDSETGEVTLYQTSATIQSVSVSADKTSAFSAVAAMLSSSVKAHAMSISEMQFQNNTPIDLPGWVNENIYLRGTAWYSYGDFNYDTNISKTYGYKANLDSDLQALQDVINGKSMLDTTRIEPQWNAACITTKINFSQYTMAAAGNVASVQGVYGWELPGLQALGTLYMECSHVSVSDNVNGSVTNPPDGSTTQQGVAMRFLKIDRAGGYAIVGLYTVQTHKQTGVSIIKMKINSFGYGAIGKKDAVTGEIVEGAIYEVYTNASCTVHATDTSGKVVVFETTASYPYSNQAELTSGTYYVKETAAPRGYVIDSTVLKLNITAGQLSWANKNGDREGWNYDIPYSGIAICKADPMTGNAVAGAVYNVYTDSSCTKAAKDVYGSTVVLTTTEDSPYSNVVMVNPGTYYAKEVQAPEKYKLDDEIYAVQAGNELDVYYINEDADDAGYLFDISNTYLNLKKISGNVLLTENNPCYSLKGAEYGVYSSREDALKDENRVETLTTDEEGNTDTVEIGIGTWYVKELAASKGFRLCNGTDGAEGGIHVVNAETPGETYTVTCEEPPGNNSFALILQKGDYDTGNPTAQGIASVNEAVFALDYYTNTDGIVSGDSFRTWYFRTDEEGEIHCRDENFLVPDYTMGDGNILKSSALYKDSGGGIIYPIGTYCIREVSPPMYYQNAGYMQFIQNPTGKADVISGLRAVIKQDKNGGETYIYDGNNVIDGVITADNLFIHVYDKPQYGSVTIYKQKADGSDNPLPGVTFKMVGLEKGDEYIATTDRDGKIKWDNLIAQNYVITEIKTADGYSLLKDNIEVRLPMEMTLDEINESGADLNKAIYDEAAGVYCFYDLTFTVDNSVRFEMPFTGANRNMLYMIPVAAFMMIVFGIIRLSRKHRGLSIRKGSH